MPSMQMDAQAHSLEAAINQDKTDKILHLVSKIRKNVELCRNLNSVIKQFVKTIDHFQLLPNKDSNKMLHFPRTYYAFYKEAVNVLSQHHTREYLNLSADCLHQLQQILDEKLEENSKLRKSNERLLLDCRHKSKQIKDLTRVLSSYERKSQNSSRIHRKQRIAKRIPVYKEAVRDCNVEIQKLRKQLTSETKKLQNEQATTRRIIRLEANRLSQKRQRNVALVPTSRLKCTKNAKITEEQLNQNSYKLTKMPNKGSKVLKPGITSSELSVQNNPETKKERFNQDLNEVTSITSQSKPGNGTILSSSELKVNNPETTEELLNRKIHELSEEFNESSKIWTPENFMILSSLGLKVCIPEAKGERAEQRFKMLGEKYRKRASELISLSKDPSLFEETLDEPEIISFVDREMDLDEFTRHRACTVVGVFHMKPNSMKHVEFNALGNVSKIKFFKKFM